MHPHWQQQSDSSHYLLLSCLTAKVSTHSGSIVIVAKNAFLGAWHQIAQTNRDWNLISFPLKRDSHPEKSFSCEQWCACKWNDRFVQLLRELAIFVRDNTFMGTFLNSPSRKRKRREFKSLPNRILLSNTHVQREYLVLLVVINQLGFKLSPLDTIIDTAQNRTCIHWKSLRSSSLLHLDGGGFIDLPVIKTFWPYCTRTSRIECESGFCITIHLLLHSHHKHTRVQLWLPREGERPHEITREKQNFTFSCLLASTSECLVWSLPTPATDWIILLSLSLRLTGTFCCSQHTQQLLEN